MHKNIKYDFIDFFFNYLILYIPQGIEFRNSYFFTTVLVRLRLHITPRFGAPRQKYDAHARTHARAHAHTHKYLLLGFLYVSVLVFIFKKGNLCMPRQCENILKTS
jgi:hypothetical protein